MDIFFLNTAKPSDLQIAVLVLMLLLCLRNLCFNGSIILPRPSQQVRKYLYCAIYRFHAYAAEQSYWKTWLRAQRAQTSAKVSIILQLKVIRVSNSDFRINSDPDVCRIAPKCCGFVTLRGAVVERRSLTGELSLSCAQPTADGWPLMWVNRRL